MDSRIRREEENLLFPPIKKDKRVGQGINAQIRKGMKESKGPFKEGKKKNL